MKTSPLRPPFRRPFRQLSIATLLAATMLATSACGAIVRTNGNLIEDSRLDRIEPGVSTRLDVAEIYGSPTTVGTFDENVWYYVGQREERLAFFRPDITERRVVVVRFNEAGVVQSVDTLTKEDGIDVQIVQRETPTLGRQMTFLEQMLGNLGRYNVDQTRQPGQIPGF